MGTQEIAIFAFMPFCKIKCTYCDFNVYANMARVMEPYAEAVAREISGFRLKVPLGFQNSDFAARSIYFGGGTPSLVPVAQIEKIMRACEESFAIQPDAEITLEANPGTMDAAKLRDLRALGVNRLSIGAQAFDDATLRRLNRGHSVADVFQTFDDARRAGFENINLDFIYGLPLQAMDDWRATLERALALASEHLSLYALRVEEHTGLESQIKRGKYPTPDDDLAADMYEAAEEMLDAAGYEHYEISNWAKRVGAKHLPHHGSMTNLSELDQFDSVQNQLFANASPLQSKHNLTYWHNEPYLGFGAGAHSYFGGERYWNVLSPLEYVERIARRQDVIAEREKINRELEMAETMILGLRLTRGVVFEEFAGRFGQDACEKYRAQLDELDKLGLVEFERPEGFTKPFGSRVRLTPRGRLLSNEVFWRFLP